jgi:TfoX/Sxy family transcriptional regulator of competence genes
MKMPNPSAVDLDYFRSIIPDGPGVEVKPMFGNLGAFVNGNMFAGLFGSDVGVKVAPADREELVAAGGGPFGPAERPMSAYLTLPLDWRHDAQQTERWIENALGHVATLPPKATKAKKTPNKAAAARPARGPSRATVTEARRGSGP